jgi:6-phosphogluconolactonase
MAAILALCVCCAMSRSEAATLVYVGNADTQDISRFHLTDDGHLRADAAVVLQSPAQPGRSVLLATSPNQRYLYAAYLSGNISRVATYAIDRSSGALSAVGLPAPLVDVMAYVTTDRSGRFLLSASYAGNKVVVNAIDASGAVAQTLQIVPTAPKAHCIVPDLGNQHVLHTSLGGDRIYQQRFSAVTGTLASNSPPFVPLPDDSGPRFLIYAPDGRFVYVVDELDARVRVFPADAVNGLLHAQIQEVTILPANFSGKPWGADIHLTRNGRFLYASERTSSTLTVFAVDKRNGLLTLVASVPTLTQPRAFSIDPSDRFLICSGQLTNSVRLYAIDPKSGQLTAIEDSPVGANPTWVEIVATY